MCPYILLTQSSCGLTVKRLASYKLIHNIASELIAALHRLHLTPLESLFVPQASLYVPEILTV